MAEFHPMINSKEEVGGIGKGGVEGITSCGESQIEIGGLDQGL